MGLNSVYMDILLALSSGLTLFFVDHSWNKMTKSPCDRDTGPTLMKKKCYSVNYFNACTLRRLLFLYAEPTNAQFIDRLSYCSYKFRHYRVILRELVVCTLLSYAIMSLRSLVIQFKIISHMFFAVESQCLKSFIIIIISCYPFRDTGRQQNVTI
jgi:hypothetical protein